MVAFSASRAPDRRSLDEAYWRAAVAHVRRRRLAAVTGATCKATNFSGCAAF